MLTGERSHRLRASWDKARDPVSSWGLAGMALPPFLGECWRDAVLTVVQEGCQPTPSLLPGKVSQPLFLGFNKRLSVPCLPAASPAAAAQVWQPDLWGLVGLEPVGWSSSGTGQGGSQGQDEA